ncbi:MAG: hypothetical protein EP344_03895 [Bacteroidetes bacterium]|nr:MAG: hypothetical protein EP344_03895 [Bacteroidota bacterium]
MEQPNRIDDLLRQRLQHAAVPPPEFVWSNIEQTLHRRRRRFILWFLAVGLAGVSLWSLWERAGQEQLPVAGVAADAPVRSETARPSEDIYPVTTDQTAQVPAGNMSAISPESQSDNRAVTRSAVPHTSDASRLEQVASQARTTAPPDVVEATETSDAAKGIAGFEASSRQADHAAPAVFKRSSDLMPGRLAVLQAPERTSAVSPITLPAPKKNNGTKKCYDFHANRQAWLVDAYVGPSLVHKELFTNNPEYKDHRQDRLATEKPAPGFNAGIRASYLFAENFLVRTGLHYDQFVEQFEYIDPNFIKYTVVITQEYVNGQWISVPDTVDIQYGSNYVKTFNRFSLLDIPLQAALELRNGPTGISLNLGGSVNLLFAKKGNIVGLDGKPVPFSPGAGSYEVFKPRVGMSLLGSIQWYYHIGPRTRVFAEPYYRHILQPVNQSGYPLEQSYGIGGIRFGVTQIFDRKL